FSTDASYRFQRNIDPAACLVAAARAAELISSISVGAEPVSCLDIDLRNELARTITIYAATVKKLLGTALNGGDGVDHLKGLGMAVTPSGGHDAYNIAVPTWRRDIEGSRDLVEEVARLTGYDLIPTTLSASDLRREPREGTERRLKFVRQILLGCGL